MWRAASEAVDFFQPTIQPTKCDVLYDFCVVWQSPRSCELFVKPHHATLIRARSVVQVHPGPPFKSRSPEDLLLVQQVPLLRHNATSGWVERRQLGVSVRACSQAKQA